MPAGPVTRSLAGTSSTLTMTHRGKTEPIVRRKTRALIQQEQKENADTGWPCGEVRLFRECALGLRDLGFGPVTHTACDSRAPPTPCQQNSGLSPKSQKTPGNRAEISGMVQAIEGHHFITQRPGSVVEVDSAGLRRLGPTEPTKKRLERSAVSIQPSAEERGGSPSGDASYSGQPSAIVIGPYFPTSYRPRPSSSLSIGGLGCSLDPHPSQAGWPKSGLDWRPGILYTDRARNRRTNAATPQKRTPQHSFFDNLEEKRSAISHQQAERHSSTFSGQQAERH